MVEGDLYYWGFLQGEKGVEGKGRDIILCVVQSHKTRAQAPIVLCIQSIHKLYSSEFTLVTRTFSLSVQPEKASSACSMLKQSTRRLKNEDPAPASSSLLPLPFAPEHQTEERELSQKCNSFLMVSSSLSGNPFLSPETGL